MKEFGNNRGRPSNSNDKNQASIIYSSNNDDDNDINEGEANNLIIPIDSNGKINLNTQFQGQGQEVENAVATTSASVLIPASPSQFLIGDTSAPECTTFQVKLECPPPLRIVIDSSELGTGSNIGTR